MMLLWSIRNCKGPRFRIRGSLNRPNCAVIAQGHGRVIDTTSRDRFSHCDYKSNKNRLRGTTGEILERDSEEVHHWTVQSGPRPYTKQQRVFWVRQGWRKKAPREAPESGRKGCQLAAPCRTGPPCWVASSPQPLDTTGSFGLE